MRTEEVVNPGIYRHVAFLNFGRYNFIFWVCPPLLAGLSLVNFPEERRAMPAVKVKENEPFEVAMRRFKRACEKAGVLTEVRRREHFEKPSEERKRKAAAAVKRHLKKLAREVARRERQH